MSMNIKKGDTVVRISGDGGKDKDMNTHQGKVLATLPKENKVVVEGMNLVTCHIKPRRQGGGGRHCQEGSRYRRLQGAGDLPQVRQGHPRRPQGGEEDRGRQGKERQRPHLQEVRRGTVREER